MSSIEKPTPDFPTLTPPGVAPIITDIFKQFSQEALGQIRNYLEQNLDMSVSRIRGIGLLSLVESNLDTGTATTTSTTYITVGPTVTIDTSGRYLILARAIMFSTPASSGGDFAVYDGTTTVLSMRDGGQANGATHTAFETMDYPTVPVTLTGRLKSQNAVDPTNAESRQILALRLGPALS